MLTWHFLAAHLAVSQKPALVAGCYCNLVLMLLLRCKAMAAPICVMCYTGIPSGWFTHTCYVKTELPKVFERDCVWYRDCLRLEFLVATHCPLTAEVWNLYRWHWARGAEVANLWIANLPSYLTFSCKQSFAQQWSVIEQHWSGAAVVIVTALDKFMEKHIDISKVQI